MNNPHTPQGGTMRYQVILDMRRHGASYGSTDDVIDADSPDAAEQSAIAQWKTLKPRDTFHPLLTLELTDESPSILELPEPFPGYDTNVASGAPADGDIDEWVTNGGEPPQGDDAKRHPYGEAGTFYRVLNFTGYGDDFWLFDDALAFAKTKFHSEFVTIWIAARVRDAQGEREINRVEVPNPLVEAPTFCARHQAGDCFDGCPYAYASCDRDHRFQVGALLRFEGVILEVAEQTWIVRERIAYPSYKLIDRTPGSAMYGEATEEDVLDTNDLALIDQEGR